MMSLFIVKEITQLLSLLSVIDDRKYVTTILRTVENEVTILKHVWNFNCCHSWIGGQFHTKSQFLFIIP